MEFTFTNIIITLVGVAAGFIISKLLLASKIIDINIKSEYNQSNFISDEKKTKN